MNFRVQEANPFTTNSSVKERGPRKSINCIIQNHILPASCNITSHRIPIITSHHTSHHLALQWSEVLNLFRSIARIFCISSMTNTHESWLLDLWTSLLISSWHFLMLSTSCEHKNWFYLFIYLFIINIFLNISLLRSSINYSLKNCILTKHNQRYRLFKHCTYIDHQSLFSYSNHGPNWCSSTRTTPKSNMENFTLPTVAWNCADLKCTYRFIWPTDSVDLRVNSTHVFIDLQLHSTLKLFFETRIILL